MKSLSLLISSSGSEYSAACYNQPINPHYPAQATYSINPYAVDSSAHLPRLAPYLLHPQQLPSWIAKVAALAHHIHFDWAEPLTQNVRCLYMGWQRIYHKLSLLGCWILAGTPCSLNETRQLVTLLKPFLKIKDGTSRFTKIRMLFEWQKSDNLLSRSQQVSHLIQEHFAKLPQAKAFPPTKTHILRTLVAARYALYLEDNVLQKLQNCESSGLTRGMMELNLHGSLFQTSLRRDATVMELLRKSACPSHVYLLLLKILKEQDESLFNEYPTISPWQLKERVAALEKNYKSPPWFAYLNEKKGHGLELQWLPAPQPAYLFLQQTLTQLHQSIKEAQSNWAMLSTPLLNRLSIITEPLQVKYQALAAWASCYFSYPSHPRWEIEEAQSSLESLFEAYPTLNQHELVIALAKNLGLLRKLALELAQFNADPQAYQNFKSVLIANYVASWIHQKAQEQVTQALHSYQLPVQVYNEWLHTSLYDELSYIDDWSLQLLRQSKKPIAHYIELLQSYETYQSLLSDQVKELFNARELKARLSSLATNPFNSTLSTGLSSATSPFSYSSYDNV